MLILTRRLGESVKIGDEVTVTVLGIKNGQVRLGVSAPRAIAVHRQEIYERIRSKRALAQPASTEIAANPALVRSLV
jgi:carbon storage regulator